jgi:hypothetical protein
LISAHLVAGEGRTVVSFARRALLAGRVRSFASV